MAFAIIKTGGRQHRVAEGDIMGAHDLEELWNALGEREAFTLFCGYSTVHFGDPRSGNALRQICQLHSHVHMSPRDLLGSFLVDACGHETRPANSPVH